MKLWQVYLIRIGFLGFSIFCPVYCFQKPRNPLHCCPKIGFHNDLLSCTNSTHDSQILEWNSSSVENRILFILFISQHIHSYASHIFFVNSVFFHKANYAFRILSSETGHDYWPQDKRWNKIKIAIDALTTWANGAKAIVLIDADLIILDHFFRVDNILDNFRHAQLILSADTTDIGNTGFLIIRNSNWSRDFFELWWQRKGTKNTFCDQHVFNILFQEIQVRGEGAMIKVLPPNEINSRWPAITNFDTSDKVLHLMGESNLLRERVGIYTANVICEHVTSQANSYDGINTTIESDLYLKDTLPYRFGLNQTILLSLLSQALFEEREIARDVCRHASASRSDYQRLHEATTAICDDSGLRLRHDSIACFQLLQEIREIHADALHKSLDADARGRSRSIEGQRKLKSDKQQRYLAGMSLFHVEQISKITFMQLSFVPPNELNQHYAQAVSAIDELELAVNMNLQDNQIFTLDKRALLDSARAALAHDVENWDDAVQYGIAAVDKYGHILSSLVQDTHSDFPAYVRAYVGAASKSSDAYRKKGDLDQALELAMVAIQNQEALMDNVHAERRAGVRDLGRYILSVGLIGHQMEVVGYRSRHLQVGEDGSEEFNRMFATTHEGSTAAIGDRSGWNLILYSLAKLDVMYNQQGVAVAEEHAEVAAWLRMQLPPQPS